MSNRELRVIGYLVLSLLLALPACTPAAYGVNEAAVEQARSAGVPLVVDTIEILRGRSNDTYLRLEFTAVDGQSIVGLVVRAALSSTDGSRIVNSSTGDSNLSLRLETGFDFRHAGEWGPYFVGSAVRCLEVDGIELLLSSGHRIWLSPSSGLDTALAHTKGELCP